MERSYDPPESRQWLLDKQANQQSPHSRSSLTLSVLVLAVSSASQSNRETLPAITDLPPSGRVRLAHRRSKVRVVA